MAQQCVICEGAIVNGRCKLCGMPYKRDRELYHLNEDRADHLRHASGEARKIMSTYPGQNSVQSKSVMPVKTGKPSGSSWHNKEVKRTGSSAAKEEQKRTRKNQKKGPVIIWIFYIMVVILFFLGRAFS